MKKSLTKACIVQEVYKKIGFSKKEAGDYVETFFEIIKDTLLDGENVKISKFGNFILRDKKERAGRNPQTGKAISISKRRTLTFKSSSILRDVLNKD